MNNPKLIFCVFCCVLLGVQTSFSQQKLNKITVLVSDSMGKPVENAIISIIDPTGSGFAFEFTNQKGLADLSFIQNMGESGIKIKVTAVTYFTKFVPFQKDKKFYPITLKVNPNELDEVLIRGKTGPRIIKTGDTSIYKTNDFSSPSDLTIADMLYKIPGIEVTESGIILFKGQQVSNLYIDGDDLFNDRLMEALKSLKIDEVESVQIIEKHQPEKILQSKKPGEQTAININLKKSSKGEWMHSLEAAGGLPAQYDASVTSRVFKPSFKSINTIKSNDAGISYLYEYQTSEKDNGEIWNEKNLFSDFLTTANYYTPSMELKRWLFNSSQTGSFNNLWKGSNNREIRVNANVIRENENMTFANTLNYFAFNDTIKYSQRGNENLEFRYYNVGLNYNINKRNFFMSDDLKVNYKDINTNDHLSASSSIILQRLRQENYGISNTFKSLHLIKNRLLSQVNSYIAFNKRPEGLNVYPGVQERVINQGRKYFGTIQNIGFNDISTTNAFSIKLLNEVIFHSYTAGFNFNRQNLNTSLKGVGDDKQIFDPGPAFSGKEKFTRFRPFVFGEWTFENDKHALTGSLYFKTSFVRFENDSSFEKVYPTLNPSIQYKFKFGNENSISLKASIEHKEGNIEDVYPSLILTDYRTIISKVLPYLKEQDQKVALKFNLQNSDKLLFGNIGIGYSREHLNYIISYKLSPAAIEVVALPFANDITLLALNAGVSKYFSSVKTNIEVKGNAGLSESQRIQQDILLPVKNFKHGYELNVLKKLHSILTLAYQLKYVDFKATMENAVGGEFDKRSSSLSNRMILNAFPGNHWKFNVSANSKLNRIADMTSYQYLMVDAFIRYKFLKPNIEVGLEGSNLTGVKNYQEIFMAANNLLVNDFNLRPAALLVRVSFNF